jgi:voltage-gated potassium channel
MGGRDDALRRNFLTVGAVAAAFLIVGTVGLMVVEKWGWSDALWMSFITLSTVGYSEGRGLDAGGRIVAIVVMLGGLVVIALLSASVTSLLVRRELLPMFRNEKTRRRIDDLRGHTILCGAGETGRAVIEEFGRAGRPLVVIERDEEASTRLREAHPDLLVVAGDATRDEVLAEANVAHAHGLITALTADAANLFVVISARSLNSDLCIVARAIDPHTQGKMYKAGATHVLSPKAIEGRRMAAMVLRPSVVNLLEVMRAGEGPPLNLEEVTIPAGSQFDGRSLRELEIPQRAGLIVIAVDPAGGGRADLVFNPQSTLIVRAGDKLVVLGEQDRIDRLGALLGRA